MKVKPNIREEVLIKGITYPSNTELIMILLGTGSKKNPVKQLAKKVEEKILQTTSDNLIEELIKLDGIGPSKAVSIAAAIELGRRQNNHSGQQIKKPTDLIPFVQHYSMETQEHFIVITLNGAHEIIKIKTISVGTINRTVVHPREVFLPAIKDMAAALIVCHNQPSGNSTPSQDDIETTQRLTAAGTHLGIQILDHIIITKKDYYSFKEHNMIPETK